MAAANTTPSGRAHAASLRERADAVRTARQVVQRAEQQHGIDDVVGQVERTGVRQARLDLDAGRPRRCVRLLDVERDQVAVVDPVSTLREPDGVSAGPAANVGDGRRRRRQMPPEDLLRAQELDDPERRVESIALGARLVVAANVLVGHRAILTVDAGFGSPRSPDCRRRLVSPWAAGGRWNAPPHGRRMSSVLYRSVRFLGTDRQTGTDVLDPSAHVLNANP
jgi:hypothetical protein